MKISRTNRITIKVTIISLLSFYVMIFVILSVQYFFIYSDSKETFRSNTELYMNSVRENMDFRNFDFLNEKNIFLPFDEGGHRIGDSVVVDNTVKSILVNEFLYLDNTDVNILLSFPENTFQEITLTDGLYYFAYKIIRGNYSVIRLQTFPSFIDYYGDIFTYHLLVPFLSAIIFFAVAFYFSRLIIRPIQEQNTSLELYNHNLAHELKTPLSVLQSDLDMFEITNDKKFLNSSKEELQYISKIIDGLLFLTKAQVNPSDFSQTNIVPTILDFITSIDSIKVIKNIETDEILQKIETHLFVSLLQNIFENAIKYGTKNEIEIVVNKKFLLFQNPVEKNLTPKELQQIEEIFCQIDISGSGAGYGLGIPMMQKIAEAFDWKVKISSKNKLFIVKIIF